MRKLRDTTELDYLTHVVFRMYENKRCASLPRCCLRRLWHDPSAAHSSHVEQLHLVGSTRVPFCLSSSI